MHASCSRSNPFLIYSLGLSLLVHGLLFSLPGSSSFQSASDMAVQAARILKIQLTSAQENTISDSSPVAHQHESETPELSQGAPDTVSKKEALLPDIPAPIYFTLPELEQPPQILQDIDTNPAELKPYAQGGTVAIRLWIDEQGNVVDLELLKSVLPAPFMDNAMKSFREARFIAGMKDGRAVKSVVTVVVNYEPLAS